MDKNKQITIMKAIGIILMVMGHSGYQYSGWIYLFHMSLFFLLAGYCYNEYYSSDIHTIIKLGKRRIKSLYLPCVIFNASILILHNLFVKLKIQGGGYYTWIELFKGIVKCLFFSGGMELSGAMWFLRTLFFTTMIYAFIDCLTARINKSKKEYMKSVVFLLTLFLGWMWADLPGGKYLNIFSVLILFHMGQVTKKQKWLEHLQREQGAVLAIVAGLILAVCYCNKVTISLASNQIANPILFLTCACSGFLICYKISLLIVRLKLEKVFIYVGAHTLPIVMLHFIAMKLVTFVQIIIYKEPMDKLTSYPYLNSFGIWWLIYTFTGVGLPLFIDYYFHKIKNYVSNPFD